MKIVVLENENEIGKAAGDLIIEEVKNNPDSVIGFATGSSPLPTYAHLVEEYRKGNVSLKGITTFNLDEYVDLPKADKNSYYSFMCDNLFSLTDVDMSKVNFLDGNTDDVDSECLRYEKAIDAAGGIGLQLLGIGTNGHIGFNEPDEKFSDLSHKVKLTDSTIASNEKYFDDRPMPHYAVTMGINSIKKAAKVILIATGAHKANAVKAMINGPVTPSCPASILQTFDNVFVFLDKEAASLL